MIVRDKEPDSLPRTNAIVLPTVAARQCPMGRHAIKLYDASLDFRCIARKPGMVLHMLHANLPSKPETGNYYIIAHIIQFCQVALSSQSWI